VGALGLGAGNFGRGRDAWHDDVRGDVMSFGGEGEGLSVISCKTYSSAYRHMIEPTLEDLGLNPCFWTRYSFDSRQQPPPHPPNPNQANSPTKP
jgi:hypothetical protein